MIAFILAVALIVVWSWARRRKGANVVRISPRSPFPPYDWFAHESSPEEPYTLSAENDNQDSLSA